MEGKGIGQSQFTERQIPKDILQVLNIFTEVSKFYEESFTFVLKQNELFILKMNKLVAWSKNSHTINASIYLTNCDIIK